MQGISATLASTVMVHQSCSTVLQTIRYSTAYCLTLRLHTNKLVNAIAFSVVTMLKAIVVESSCHFFVD